MVRRGPHRSQYEVTGHNPGLSVVHPTDLSTDPVGVLSTSRPDPGPTGPPTGHVGHVTSGETPVPRPRCDFGWYMMGVPLLSGALLPPPALVGGLCCTPLRDTGRDDLEPRPSSGLGHPHDVRRHFARLVDLLDDLVVSSGCGSWFTGPYGPCDSFLPSVSCLRPAPGSPGVPAGGRGVSPTTNSTGADSWTPT